MPLMKIFIATPANGGLTYARYTQSIFSLEKALTSAGHQTTFAVMVGSAEIASARNELVQYFLDSDCDALLFIDADQAFNAIHVREMIESGKHFIGAVIPQKVIDWEKVRLAAIAGVPATELSKAAGIFNTNFLTGKVDIVHGKPLAVRHVGTGLIYLSRVVFEKLSPHCQVVNLRTKEAKTTRTEYFTNIVTEDNERLSEDYSFCHKWREIGGKVYAAPWVEVSHIGSFEFNGQLRESMKKIT